MGILNFLSGGAKKAASEVAKTTHQPGDLVSPTGPSRVDDKWNTVAGEYGGGAPVKNTVWGAKNQRIDITSTGAVVETVPGGTAHNIGYVDPAKAMSFKNPAQVRANLASQNSLAETGVADHSSATQVPVTTPGSGVGVSTPVADHSVARQAQSPSSVGIGVSTPVADHSDTTHAQKQSVGIGVSTPVADHSDAQHAQTQRPGAGIGISTPVADHADASRTRQIPVTTPAVPPTKAGVDPFGTPTFSDNVVTAPAVTTQQDHYASLLTRDVNSVPDSGIGGLVGDSNANNNGV